MLKLVPGVMIFVFLKLGFYVSETVTVTFPRFPPHGTMLMRKEVLMRSISSPTVVSFWSKQVAGGWNREVCSSQVFLKVLLETMCKSSVLNYWQEE